MSQIQNGGYPIRAIGGWTSPNPQANPGFSALGLNSLAANGTNGQSAQGMAQQPGWNQNVSPTSQGIGRNTIGGGGMLGANYTYGSYGQRQLGGGIQNASGNQFTNSFGPGSPGGMGALASNSQQGNNGMAMFGQQSPGQAAGVGTAGMIGQQGQNTGAMTPAMGAQPDIGLAGSGAPAAQAQWGSYPYQAGTQDGASDYMKAAAQMNPDMRVPGQQGQYFTSTPGVFSSINPYQTGPSGGADSMLGKNSSGGSQQYGIGQFGNYAVQGQDGSRIPQAVAQQQNNALMQNAGYNPMTGTLANQQTPSMAVSQRLSALGSNSQQQPQGGGYRTINGKTMATPGGGRALGAQRVGQTQQQPSIYSNPRFL